MASHLHCGQGGLAPLGGSGAGLSLQHEWAFQEPAPPLPSLPVPGNSPQGGKRPRPRGTVCPSVHRTCWTWALARLRPLPRHLPAGTESRQSVSHPGQSATLPTAIGGQGPRWVEQQGGSRAAAGLSTPSPAAHLAPICCPSMSPIIPPDHVGCPPPRSVLGGGCMHSQVREAADQEWVGREGCAIIWTRELGSQQAAPLPPPLPSCPGEGITVNKHPTTSLRGVECNKNSFGDAGLHQAACPLRLA